MPLSKSQIAQKFISAAEPPLTAGSMGEFLQGLNKGHLELYEELFSSTPEMALSALDEAFAQTRRTPRQRRVLELCAWPIFDKPSLPLQTSGLPEFLWLFAMPMLVRLKESDDPLMLVPGDCLDMEALIETVESSGCMNPKALVSGFTALYSRDDLHAYGPRGIAERFVLAESSGELDLPLPLPVVRDPDIESGRTVVLYALMAARLPAGEKKLFVKEAWPVETLRSIYAAALKTAGIEFDELQVLDPCHMSESLLRCTDAGGAEMRSWLELGIAHYGITQAYLAVPTDGMGELIGLTKDGEELLLAPTFAFTEPTVVLNQAVESLCKDCGIGFKGLFVSAAPSSSALH